MARLDSLDSMLKDAEAMADEHSKAMARRDLEDSDGAGKRSEEHTSELQSLMRISYAVFCLNKKNPVYPTKCSARKCDTGYANTSTPLQRQTPTSRTRTTNNHRFQRIPQE